MFLHNEGQQESNVYVEHLNSPPIRSLTLLLDLIFLDKAPHASPNSRNSPWSTNFAQHDTWNLANNNLPYLKNSYYINGQFHKLLGFSKE